MSKFFKCDSDWVKYIKNPFTRKITNLVSLVEVKDDRVLKVELKKYLDKYKDIAYLDSECIKVSWLKEFKETQYTLAYVEEEDYPAFKKNGFKIIDFDDNKLVMIMKNF